MMWTVWTLASVLKSRDIISSGHVVNLFRYNIHHRMWGGMNRIHTCLNTDKQRYERYYQVRISNQIVSDIFSFVCTIKLCLLHLLYKYKYRTNNVLVLYCLSPTSPLTCTFLETVDIFVIIPSCKFHMALILYQILELQVEIFCTSTSSTSTIQYVQTRRVSRVACFFVCAMFSRYWGSKELSTRIHRLPQLLLPHLRQSEVQ